MQIALAPIPQGNCEHPDAALQGRRQAPGGDCVDQRLNIGLTVPAARRVQPGLVECRARFAMIVYRAVGRDYLPALGTNHRLMAVGRKIDNR